MVEGFGVAAGFFIGNWLLVPFVFKQSYKKGFAVGVITALLVLGFHAIFL